MFVKYDTSTSPSLNTCLSDRQGHTSKQICYNFSMEFIPIAIFIFLTIFLNKKKREKATLNGGVRKVPKNAFEKIIDYYKKEMERQKEAQDLETNKTKKQPNLPNQTQTTPTPIPYERIPTPPTRKSTSLKPVIDIRTILFIPFLLVALSLFITKAKIGGTIMSTLHGWPYPLLNHQIKDVVDNIPINEWIVNLGSFYHYVVFDYLFYLVITIVLYSFIKLANRD